jgi:hypothetical protein
MKNMVNSFVLCSPKQRAKTKDAWSKHFPYYAGFSEDFAFKILQNFEKSMEIFDPWNGSGTTTYVASILGLKSRGLDLNPIMVVSAIARLISPLEADSIEPLAVEIARQGRTRRTHIDDTDPLLQWFAKDSAREIRAVERSIRRQLVGKMTTASSGARIDRISTIAAAFYVALFSVARDQAATLRSSNPTWFRRPRHDAEKIVVTPGLITEALLAKSRKMATALASRRDLLQVDQAPSQVVIGDTTEATVPNGTIDLILTSPPYCTRIDYSAATRIELAVLFPLIRGISENLAQKMIGSVRVPNRDIEASGLWGERCNRFLQCLYKHPSKASSGYYYRTHLDYFDKICRSLVNIAPSLKQGGIAILVVQDSYYKNIHNDLPAIVTEMAELQGLELRRREDFVLRQSMSRINPYTRAYRAELRPVETVLCFKKVSVPAVNEDHNND